MEEKLKKKILLSLFKLLQVKNSLLTLNNIHLCIQLVMNYYNQMMQDNIRAGFLNFIYHFLEVRSRFVTVLLQDMVMSFVILLTFRLFK